MKKAEKIIISRQLAIDLIWWLEHASAPCMTIGEVHKHWHLFKDSQMTLARDSMKDELEKALVAKKGAKQVWLTIEEARKTANAYADLAAISSVLLNVDDEMMFLDIHNELMHRIKQAEKANADN